MRTAFSATTTERSSTTSIAKRDRQDAQQDPPQRPLDLVLVVELVSGLVPPTSTLAPGPATAGSVARSRRTRALADGDSPSCGRRDDDQSRAARRVRAARARRRRPRDRARCAVPRSTARAAVAGSLLPPGPGRELHHHAGLAGRALAQRPSRPPRSPRASRCRSAAARGSRCGSADRPPARPARASRARRKRRPPGRAGARRAGSTWSRTTAGRVLRCAGRAAGARRRRPGSTARRPSRRRSGRSSVVAASTATTTTTGIPPMASERRAELSTVQIDAKRRDHRRAREHDGQPGRCERAGARGLSGSWPARTSSR